MVVLLLGGQVIDSKMGAGWIGEEISPPSSLLDLKFFPLSHIHISCLFLLVTELLIGPISSRGGGLLQHQSSANNHQLEGLGPE